MRMTVPQAPLAQTNGDRNRDRSHLRPMRQRSGGPPLSILSTDSEG